VLIAKLSFRNARLAETMKRDCPLHNEHRPQH